MPSTWRQAQAHKSSAGVNTHELDVSEVQTQTVERFGVGCQTDTEAAGKAAAKAAKKAEATLPGFLDRCASTCRVQARGSTSRNTAWVARRCVRPDASARNVLAEWRGWWWPSLSAWSTSTRPWSL